MLMIELPVTSWPGPSALEEDVVRIIWAGHILFYITKNRSQAELH